MKKYFSTLLLAALLIILSVASLFIGVIDIDLRTLLSDPNSMELKKQTSSSFEMQTQTIEEIVYTELSQ